MRRLLFRLIASAHTTTDHVPDAELLRRLVASNDPAALELLVRRHAGAVWAACRRLLRSDADAEDAFQATFLALIRKAHAIRTGCVGGWLHRVAVNAALKLRERARHAAPTDPSRLAEVPAPVAAPLDADLIAAAHEELAQLSDRERLPVVLCDLEGLSHADAAAALGWPVGTVSGRLSRARAKLRERLTRRGLAPSVALLPALTAPPWLISTAVSLTAGAPPAVVSLTEGVFHAMRTAKLKLVAVVITATGLVALTTFGSALARASKAAPIPHSADQRPVDANEPAEPDDKPKVDQEWRKRPFPSAYPEIPVLDAKFLAEFEKKHVEPIYESDPLLRKLQKAKLSSTLYRLNLALGEVDNLTNAPPKGAGAYWDRLHGTLQELAKQTTNAINLAMDIHPTRDGQRPWLVLRVAVEKRAERVFENFSKTGGFARADNDISRLDAEIELAKHDAKK